MEAALAAPLNSPPLKEIARGRRTACILVSDVTRPVPNGEILPPILAHLKAAGIADENILLLIATGLHRPSTQAERLEMLGGEIVTAYRIEDHDGRDLAMHRYLGDTPRGIPAWIDKRYVDADLKIVTGLVEPHLMAGYSGGRKAICPGISAVETIRRWHGPELLESDLACVGSLKGNPVHEEAVEVAKLAGCDFAVNVVLDSQRRVAALHAGALGVVFEAAVSSFNRIGRVDIDRPAPIVVTSSAGYPLDATWYQAIKGLTGALPAVERGGTIIMAAGLREGVGGEEFRQVVSATRSFEEFMCRLRQEGYFAIDQWQYEELVKAARQAQIMVYSDESRRADLARSHVQPVESVESAVHEALLRHGKSARILVIPHGPYVLPSARSLA
jgi:nickel-dependent lactate racemase